MRWPTQEEVYCCSAPMTEGMISRTNWAAPRISSSFTVAGGANRNQKLAPGAVFWLTGTSTRSVMARLIIGGSMARETPASSRTKESSTRGLYGISSLTMRPSMRRLFMQAVQTRRWGLMTRPHVGQTLRSGSFSSMSSVCVSTAAPLSAAFCSTCSSGLSFQAVMLLERTTSSQPEPVSASRMWLPVSWRRRTARNFSSGNSNFCWKPSSASSQPAQRLVVSTTHSCA